MCQLHDITIHSTHTPCSSPTQARAHVYCMYCKHEMSQPQQNVKNQRILFASFAVMENVYFFHLSICIMFWQTFSTHRLIHLFFVAVVVWRRNGAKKDKKGKNQLLSPPPFAVETIFRINSNRARKT